jgi:hypothetical protein
MRRAVVMVAVLAGAGAAHAHHILGIPHYAYDEQYPQTPVLTYRVDAGPWTVKMTGYPGVPQPGERTSLHVYLQHAASGRLFDGPVTLTVRRDRLLGTDPVVYGPVTTTIEEAVFKFHPEFAETANYVAHVHFDADGEPWDLELPIVVGEPGSPWLVLGGVAATLIVFLLVVRALRIKRAREDRRHSRRPRPRRPAELRP